MKALVAVAALVAALSLVPSAFADRFSATVDQILAQPYQADYVPLGVDSAFDTTVPNTLPAEDFTTGSIPDSPDYPAWPAAFSQVLFHSVTAHRSSACSPCTPATMPASSSCTASTRMATRR